MAPPAQPIKMLILNFLSNFIYIYIYFFFFLIIGLKFLLFYFRAEIINSRKTNTIKFLFAWVIPTCMMLEIIPTKLPHYVLPLYPAIAIIISYWMTNVAKKEGHKSTFSLNAIVASDISCGLAPLTSHTSTINALLGKIEIANKPKDIKKVL